MKDKNDKAFNLLREPWIRVMLFDCGIQDVSLLTLFEHAHEYRALAGEMPTQDVAILRFLLAVVHTALSPVDENGKRRTYVDADEALDDYEDLWKMKRFPFERIRDYLLEWEDRFWLFHPTHPFWQVPLASNGTEGSAAKLNGEISESNNKQKLFSKRSGFEKQHLDYAEAARWLLHLNGFDDTSAKPKQKGLPSPGTGWLGKLGLVYADGDNLFQTIVLNLYVLDDQREPWGVNKPCWELDVPRAEERIEIPAPRDQAQLLTLQSRRLLLIREGEKVFGYTLLGGDFFEKNNAYVEQMTMWRHVAAKGADPERDIPKRHDPEKQLWREFPSLITSENNSRTPGAVSWIRFLQSKNVSILDRTAMVRFNAVSLNYGDKDFFATEVYSDSLGLHAQMLAEIGTSWQKMTVEMLSLSEEVATAVGNLSNNLFLAAGGDPEKAERKNAMEQFYYRLDMPFRNWLYNLDPENEESNLDVARVSWRNTLKSVAKKQGQQMIEQCSIQAYTGHKVKDRHYCAAEAYNRFCAKLTYLLG